MVIRYPILNTIVDSVTTCEEVGKDKPDPAVFLKAMEKLGLTVDDCVVFEDSVTGLKGA